MRVEKREGGAAFQEGEDSVGILIDGKVFANIPLRGFPDEGALGGIELDQKGPVTQGRSKGRLVGDRLVRTGCGWVHLGGRGG